MSISVENYKASETSNIKKTIIDFLEKNKENTYTLKEIKEHIAKNHDDWMIHMELTSLVWSGIVEYRDIYDSKGKLDRYFKIADNKNK
jgi:hypothetical protein